MRWCTGLLLAGLCLALGPGCNDRRPTEQRVCDRLVPALCEYQIRCGLFASTQSDCELVEGRECCSGDFCDELSTTSYDDLSVCAAAIRGSTCGSGPTISSACPARIRSANPPPTPADAGP